MSVKRSFDMVALEKFLENHNKTKSLISFNNTSVEEVFIYCNY
jgi:hypothetical protein